MDYRKYMHIERLGREEVDGILNGEVFVFTKIDGTEQIGEGIVIKNYDFHNMYGRTTFAKIVAKEFLQNKKELHQKNKEAKTSDDICIKAVNDFLTDEMIEKEYSKLLQEMKPAENRSKFIGMLLNRIWHEFLTEEIADIDKKYKHPTLNLRALRVELENKVKSVKKELF